eukprot:1158469-Pelagomonas_calceolata.AAC.5
MCRISFLAEVDNSPISLDMLFLKSNHANHKSSCSPNQDENRRSPDHSPGLRSPHNGPQLPLGPIFTPKIIFETAIFITNILLIQKKERRRSKIDLFGNPCVAILQGKRLKFCIWSTTACDGQRVRFTSRLIRHMGPNLGRPNHGAAYILQPILTGQGWGPPMLGAFQKHAFGGRSYPALAFWQGNAEHMMYIVSQNAYFEWKFGRKTTLCPNLVIWHLIEIELPAFIA